MATVKISRSGSNIVANPLGYIDRSLFDSYRRCVGSMRLDAARRVQWTPDAKIAAQAAAKLVEAGFSILYEPASLAEDLASVSDDTPIVVAPPTIGVTIVGTRVHFAPTTRLDSEWSSYMACVQSFTVYDRDAKCNAAMSKDAAVRAVSALQDAGFRIEAGEGVEALLKSAIATRAVETHEGEARLAAVEARLTARGAALYPFQRAGVRWLLGRQNALLADEMGLGKTVQTIVALPESAPTLIICPAVAKGVWRRELAKWVGRPVTILKGRGSLRWPAKGEVLVTNYDVLQGANELGAPPAGLCVVADEAHAVKNPKAQRSLSFRALCEAARSVEGRVWLLTATPLLNQPMELWTILHHAGLAKEAFGSFGTFKESFGARMESVTRNVSALVWGRPNSEVGKRLERVMLRRLRADVLPDLPGKVYKTIPVEIPKATAKKFDAILAEMERAGGVDATISGFAKAERDGKGEAIKAVLTRGSVGFEQMSEARALLALAKTQALVDLVNEIEEEGEPIVVFSAHRHPIDLLGKRPGWAVITGDTKPEERTVIEDRFQNGKLKGVACTIKAGGVAITLTKAHQAIFVDQEWTPALNQQAEDRVCRIGQTRGVVISLLVCEHPLDERVAELLTGKSNLINGSVERGRVTSADGIPASLPPAPVRFDELAAEAKLALEEEIRRIDPKLARTPGTSQEGVPRPAESAVERWAAAGLQVVAAMDQDRAMEQNGIGFSKFDNDWGHKLAAIASTGLATPRQWLAICKLAHRYRGQIGADVSRYEEATPRQVEEGESEPEPAPAPAKVQATTVPFSATITSKSVRPSGLTDEDSGAGRPLYGHDSFTTAYTVADYPYGFKLRTEIRYWLEESPKLGWRFVSQTKNPKTGRWNEPKKSTYTELAACMFLDDKGHVTWTGVGGLTSPENILAFVKRFPKADLSRLVPFVASAIKTQEAFASGTRYWRVRTNGTENPEAEAKARADSMARAAIEPPKWLAVRDALKLSLNSQYGKIAADDATKGLLKPAHVTDVSTPYPTAMASSVEPTRGTTRHYDAVKMLADGSIERHEKIRAEELPALVGYGTTLVVADPLSRAMPLSIVHRDHTICLIPVNSKKESGVGMSYPGERVSVADVNARIVAAVAQHFG